MVTAKSSSTWLLWVLGLAILGSTIVDAQLSTTFYDTRCPGGVNAVTTVIRNAVRSDRTLAPSLLRLHFHDCFVRGCDGSVLLDSPRGEKNSIGNRNSLRGFNVIDAAKAQVEAMCPGVISCADILALAARDGMRTISGPGLSNWQVPLGRRDGVVTSAAEANRNLPSANANFNQLARLFASKGLSTTDLVLLSGAHSVGRSRCISFQSRLYNFSSTARTDPSMNPTFAANLKRACRFGDTTTRVLMDQSTRVDTWDNHYYANILNGRALFTSDDSLRRNPAGLRVVNQENRATSDARFGAAMVKMGRIGVLTGRNGQIRRRCNAVNS